MSDVKLILYIALGFFWIIGSIGWHVVMQAHRARLMPLVRPPITKDGKNE